MANSLPDPDPLASLAQQKYFHGMLSRVDAEALLVRDGEFLVRKSAKKVGQYVLTGMANSKPQHLLLIDKDGKVSSVEERRGVKWWNYSLELG